MHWSKSITIRASNLSFNEISCKILCNRDFPYGSSSSSRGTENALPVKNYMSRQNDLAAETVSTLLNFIIYPAISPSILQLLFIMHQFICDIYYYKALLWRMILRWCYLHATQKQDNFGNVKVLVCTIRRNFLFFIFAFVMPFVFPATCPLEKFSL